MANKLQDFPVPNFRGGYNSYTASKSNIGDNEIPLGSNAALDDNGSMSKVAGKSVFGAQINSGHAVLGGGTLKNTSNNKVIVSSGTTWYYVNGIAATSTALTGTTFTTDLDTDFEQAVDRLYGANGTDNLAYTTDGATITSVSSNGNIGRWPVSFNTRLYMTNTANPDRIYYSNPYSYDTATASYAISNFGTFNTDLTTTPKKNAGFIILLPGGGVEIVRLYKDGDYLYAYTKRHGTWKIGAVSAANADGSIAHTISQTSTAGNCISGRSVVKNQNDQWFYNDGYYSFGEVATFQSPRQSTQSGRIRSELNSVATAGKPKVAATLYKERIYIAYQVGTYNDRVVIFDNRIGAFSTPISGINASWFAEYIDDNGVRRLLAGSSKSTDSFVYELESGTSFAGTAITSFFETKSFDCGRPGLIKRFAFIDVFYSLLVGRITYTVYTDENTQIATDSIQIGSSATTTSGIGSLAIGTFPVGMEYASSGVVSVATNSKFRIDCGFADGKKVSVRITNNNLAEQYKVDSMKIYYKPGSIYE